MRLISILFFISFSLTLNANSLWPNLRIYASLLGAEQWFNYACAGHQDLPVEFEYTFALGGHTLLYNYSKVASKLKGNIVREQLVVDGNKVLLKDKDLDESQSIKQALCRSFTYILHLHLKKLLTDGIEQKKIAIFPFRRINVAKYVLFQRFLWRFDVILVILSQNLRRYTSYNVALVY